MNDVGIILMPENESKDDLQKRFLFHVPELILKCPSAL